MNNANILDKILKSFFMRYFQFSPLKLQKRKKKSKIVMEKNREKRNKIDTENTSLH